MKTMDEFRELVTDFKQISFLGGMVCERGRDDSEEAIHLKAARTRLANELLSAIEELLAVAQARQDELLTEAYAHQESTLEPCESNMAWQPPPEPRAARSPPRIGRRWRRAGSRSK